MRPNNRSSSDCECCIYSCFPCLYLTFIIEYIDKSKIKIDFELVMSLVDLQIFYYKVQYNYFCCNFQQYGVEF